MSEENNVETPVEKLEIPELKVDPSVEVDTRVFLNYANVTVAEVLNETFLLAIGKLRRISLPIHQRIVLKDLCLLLDNSYKKYNEEKNDLIQKFGHKDEKTGSFTVSFNELAEDVQKEFLADWNGLHQILIPTNLKEKFVLPSSEASLSLDESELIERFLRIPGANR